jgi:hypothetical protein
MEPMTALWGVLVILLIMGIIALAVLLWQRNRPDGDGSRGNL